MAKATEVIKQMMRDIKELRSRVGILEKLINATIGEKACQKLPDAPQPIDKDSWDPSRGPRPAHLRKAGTPCVAHEDHVVLHRRDGKNQ